MLITHDERLASRHVCLALVATAGLLVLTSCSGLLDDSGFKVINDTGKSVWLIECSQDRPDFPGPTVIKPGGTLEMQGDWLPADDPGAACYLASSPGSSKALFSGCLEMPTDDNDRITYKVSEARSGSNRKTCMDLSSPGRHERVRTVQASATDLQTAPQPGLGALLALRRFSAGCPQWVSWSVHGPDLALRRREIEPSRGSDLCPAWWTWGLRSGSAGRFAALSVESENAGRKRHIR